MSRSIGCTAGSTRAGSSRPIRPAQPTVVGGRLVPTVVASATDIATGIDHHAWLDQIQPNVNVPKVDTTVRHSGEGR